MNWKEKLKIFEENKKWDTAIAFMQKMIAENPDDMEMYIFINFLIMNIVVEEEYDRTKEPHYALVLKKYYDESYKKFHNNAEYLFFTGQTGVMAPWYFDIDLPNTDEMIKKAQELAPENLLYKFEYFWKLFTKNKTDPEAIWYAKTILDPESCIQKELTEKGSLGEHLLEIISFRAKQMLGTEKYLP